MSGAWNTNSIPSLPGSWVRYIRPVLALAGRAGHLGADHVELPAASRVTGSPWVWGSPGAEDGHGPPGEQEAKQQRGGAQGAARIEVRHGRDGVGGTQTRPGPSAS